MGKSSHTRIITWGDIAHNTVRRPDNTAHQARNTVRRPDRVGPGSVRGVQGATGRDRTRSVRGVLVDHIFLKKREKRKEKNATSLHCSLLIPEGVPGMWSVDPVTPDRGRRDAACGYTALPGQVHGRPRPSGHVCNVSCKNQGSRRCSPVV